MLGGVYEAQGRGPEAAQVYAGLQTAPAGDAIAHLMLASYQTRLYAQDNDARHLDDAVRELQESLEAAGTEPVTEALLHDALGQVYYMQKKYVAAQGEFQAALVALPADADAQAWLGDIALLDGDPAAAIAAYSRAEALLPAYSLQISADNARTLAVSLAMRRGLALTRQAKTEEAATAFEQASAAGKALLADAPQWAQAHFALAAIYLAQGDQAGADDEFATSFQCDQSLVSLRGQVEANLAALLGR